MKTYFLCFADEKYDLTRIHKEARDLNIFDEIWCWDEHDLDANWIEKHYEFIRNNPRGFGYWIWKSQCVLQALNKMDDGDVLVYADAGCVLCSEGVPRLKMYIDAARHHPSNMLSFALEYPESQWTKMDLFKTLDYTGFNDRQLMATTFVLCNTQNIRNLVQKWVDSCAVYHNIDDSPSIEHNAPNFVEHRHDQSVWSIYRKQHGSVVIHDETWWNGAWDSHKHYPIHARRMLTRK